MHKPDSSATAGLPVSGWAWKMLGLLWLAYFLNYIDRQIVFSIFPILRRELGFSETQLGLTGSVFIWVYSACMPLTGRIADLVRRDRIVIVSLVLWSFATLGTALSASPAQWLVWRAVMGVTESLYVPAALGLLADLHPGPTRSRALAIHATAQFAGIVAGGWFGGWVADRSMWRYGFALLAGIGVGYAFLLGRIFRRFSDQRLGQSKEQASPLIVFRSRCYLALSLAFIAFCFLLWILYAWLPNWIYESYALSMSASGFIATFYLQAGTVAGVLGGGVIGDRAAARAPGGRFYTGAAGLLLCAPLAWLCFATHSLALLELAAAAFGLLSGLFIANLFAAAFDVVDEKNYGFGAGVLNMGGGLSGGVAMLLAGVWKQSIGIPALVSMAAAATGSLAVLLFVAVAARFTKDRNLMGATGQPH